MEKRGNKRDLELDLLATERRRRGQGRDQADCSGELLHCLNQRRTLQRALTRLAPQARRLLGQPGLGAVTRQQLGLVLCDLGELAFQNFGNARVQPASRLAQQRAIGGVLHQGMLEQVCRLRRHALAEQQPCGDEPVERRSQVCPRLARHRRQKGVRELPPDGCADLRHVLGGAEPVEPRHQGGVQTCRDRVSRRRNRSGQMLGRTFAFSLQNRLGHLLDEQWDAVGALDDILPDALRNWLVSRDAVDDGIDIALWPSD